MTRTPSNGWVWFDEYGTLTKKMIDNIHARYKASKKRSDCPHCKSKQIQLISCIKKASWRCRDCRKVFYE